MSGSTKLGLYILIAVVIGFFAIKMVMAVVASVLPILILAALGLLVFGIVSRKALAGGRRTLP